MRKLVSVILTVLTLIFIGAFQNCSGKMEFSSYSEKDVLCNPLDSTATCSLGDGSGLVGNLYYLTANHAHLFDDSLHNTVLNDYFTHGVKVNKVVIMNQINVAPQAWDIGFSQWDGSLVNDENGNTLLEWFALDLRGFIELPAGRYQFATLSDDGMRVKIDGDVVVDDDGLHAPRWKCSETEVSFSVGQKRQMQVQYFQGPRNQISMQLFVRPADQSAQPCDETGGWSEAPTGTFSHTY